MIYSKSIEEFILDSNEKAVSYYIRIAVSAD